MKTLYLIGNWKSNKTIAETKEWLAQLSEYKAKLEQFADLRIILCAPYTALSTLKDEIERLGLPISAGAQDLSPFVEGAYTGAVTARMVREVADYVIVGHSERRKYFGETDEMLQKKVDQAKLQGLKVVYCVPDATSPIAKGCDIVGYEPTWAIGSGQSETPENANAVIAKIKATTGVPVIVYGGSVTAENVASYLVQPEIDGVLLGGASLDPGKFFQLLQTAVSAPQSGT